MTRKATLRSWPAALTTASPKSTWATPRCGWNRLAEGNLDGRLVRRGRIRSDPLGRLRPQTLLHLRRDRPGVLDRTCPRADRQDQAMLGAISDVVPPDPLVVIGRVGGVAVRLLLP